MIFFLIESKNEKWSSQIRYYISIVLDCYLKELVYLSNDCKMSFSNWCKNYIALFFGISSHQNDMFGAVNWQDFMRNYVRPLLFKYGKEFIGSVHILLSVIQDIVVVLREQERRRNHVEPNTIYMWRNLQFTGWDFHLCLHEQAFSLEGIPFLL